MKTSSRYGGTSDGSGSPAFRVYPCVVWFDSRKCYFRFSLSLYHNYHLVHHPPRLCYSVCRPKHLTATRLRPQPQSRPSDASLNLSASTSSSSTLYHSSDGSLSSPPSSSTSLSVLSLSLHPFSSLPTSLLVSAWSKLASSSRIPTSSQNPSLNSSSALQTRTPLSAPSLRSFSRSPSSKWFMPRLDS